MKYRKFKIELFDWDVQLAEVESPKDEKKAKKLLEEFPAEDMIDDVAEAVRRGVKDGGWHIYNTGSRKTLILLFELSSPEQRVNILCHEKRHAEDRILKELSIKDIETAAFIAGYLGEKLL